jgi:hypothetical protein
MKTNFIWLTIILSIILLGLLVFINREEITQNSEEETVSESQKAEEVSLKFINNFILIAPPAVNIQAEKDLLNSLSENVLSKIDKEMLATEMASFVGVQDIPDQGVEIGELTLIDQENADLRIVLIYSGGEVEKIINLIKEEGEWKVNSVDNKDLFNFIKTGNIVINNPGYPENVWHLVYEEPAKPAVTKALNFTDESLCSQNDTESICDPDSLLTGVRVELKGFENENEIEVINLKILE